MNEQSTQIVEVRVTRARRDRITGWAATCTICGLVGDDEPVVVPRKAASGRIASRHLLQVHAGKGVVRVQQ